MPKRVLLILDTPFKPQAFGGIESSTHAMSTFLKASNVEVAVLGTLEGQGVIYYVNRLKSKMLGLIAPSDKANGYPSYRCWSLLEGLREVLERFRPEVAFVNQYGNYIQAVRLLADAGVRSVVFFRDNEYTLSESDVRTLSGSSLVSNSLFTAKRLESKYGLESKVVRPLVDPRSCLANSTGDKVTLVGITEKKGVLLAIDVAEKLSNVPFLFVRSWAGFDEAILNRILAIPNATYMEPVDDVRLVYTQTKLLIVPSVWEEAWGRVVTEAQINGIPVLASDKGGLPESVGAGGEIILPAGDADKWSSRILHYYSDHHAYSTLSKAAKERASLDDIEYDAVLNDTKLLI